MSQYTDLYKEANEAADKNLDLLEAQYDLDSTKAERTDTKEGKRKREEDYLKAQREDLKKKEENAQAQYDYLVNTLHLAETDQRVMDARKDLLEAQQKAADLENQIAEKQLEEIENRLEDWENDHKKVTARMERLTKVYGDGDLSARADDYKNAVDTYGKDSDEARKAKYEGTTSAILAAVTAFQNLNYQMGYTDDDGKTIAVTLPSVTKSIRIIVGRTPLPDYKVTFDLDCVNVLDPVKTIQKGETVTFHLESVTPYYVIDTITIKMNGYERYNRIAWDGLNAATIILPVDGDIVITAVAKARFTLEECSWGMIDRIAKSGRGGEFFKPGDRKSLGSIDRIGGNSFNYSSTPSDVPMDAILLGINHNPSIEGAGNMHFCIGKHDAEWTYPVTGSYLNSTATNLGGVLGSELMPLIGTEIPAAPVEKAPSADYPDEPAKDTLLWSLPYELTQVLKKAPKTVYDTKTDKIVTERSYLWLLSATEVFGTEKEWGSSTFAYEAESATQQQYEFFKIDKMDERRNFVSWLRSPSGFTSTTKTAFCAVNTSSTTVQDKDGTIHNVYYGGPGYDDANKTKNVLLCFALGSGDTDVLDKMTLDRSVLG